MATPGWVEKGTLENHCSSMKIDQEWLACVSPDINGLELPSVPASLAKVRDDEQWSPTTSGGWTLTSLMLAS